MAARQEKVQQGGAWIVGNPGAAEVAAALFVGSVGLLILGLQPVLLGALYSEGRMTFDELALAATLEMIAIAAGSAVMALAFAPQGLRRKAACLLLVLAALSHLTAIAGSPAMIIGVRTLAGLAEGGLVAIATELIARSARPERMGGIFLTIQTTAQCLLSMLLTLLVVPAYGSAGGFQTLAVVGIVALAAVPLLPRRYEGIPTAGRADAGIGGPMALLALAIIFTFYLFIGAIWAFLEPLGLASGVSSQTVGLITAAALAAQVGGAFAATLVERRLDYRAAITLSTTGGLIAAGLFAALPGLALFWLAALVTGFVWLFVVPYQIRLTIVADPSRRTALLVPAAQLLGAALGPAGASLLISGDDVRAVPFFGMTCLAMTLLLLAVFCLKVGHSGISRSALENGKDTAV
ncbi:MFS transporter [Mycoplana rhizolycopersici]|uniref:MFS transporter n=1 Tax=Mycoplana rhizolycopersici TaxID=2746702 RepID=A0ABX2QBH5_9HYPH|nr:MFS transporter [Rhizobium rhizolycopersici]NVP55090.1 MFS transporter [Rhizobium rhizolycopersici]